MADQATTHRTERAKDQVPYSLNDHRKWEKRKKKKFSLDKKEKESRENFFSRFPN